MGWHGSVIFHRENIANWARGTSSLDTFCIAHILGNDTTQESIAVGSILEAVCERVKA